ncbi:MAG: SixA phosphatase family protein [Luteimonas sp.]
MLPLLLALVLAASGCASTQSGPASDATYLVVRHAEKATDDPRDPSLTAAGRHRAAALATQLADAPVVAVYGTGFQRTQQTAAPVAARHGLVVRTYDAQQAADAFADRLRHAHAHGTVVVVGHSNTVPGIVSALCTCAVAPIDESDYGNRYTIGFDARGRPTLRHEHD